MSSERNVLGSARATGKMADVNLGRGTQADVAFGRFAPSGPITPVFPALGSHLPHKLLG